MASAHPSWTLLLGFSLPHESIFCADPPLTLSFTCLTRIRNIYLSLLLLFFHFLCSEILASADTLFLVLLKGRPTKSYCNSSLCLNCLLTQGLSPSPLSFLLVSEPHNIFPQDDRHVVPLHPLFRTAKSNFFSPVQTRRDLPCQTSPPPPSF